MAPHRDCCLGLCNATEPEINCQDLFPEYFARLLPNPHSLLPKTHFYLLSVSHFIALSHLLFCHPLSSSHCASVVLLSITSSSPLFLSFSLFFFYLHYSFPSPYISTGFSGSLFSPACAPVLCLSLSYVSYIFILSLSPHFPLQTSSISAPLQSYQWGAAI